MKVYLLEGSLGNYEPWYVLSAHKTQEGAERNKLESESESQVSDLCAFRIKEIELKD